MPMVNACPVFGGAARDVSIATDGAQESKECGRSSRSTMRWPSWRDHTWAALKALRALNAQWDEGANRSADNGRSDCRGRRGARSRRAHRGERGRRREGGSRGGATLRGDVSNADARARRDGAAELHGAISRPIAATSGSAVRSSGVPRRLPRRPRVFRSTSVSIHNQYLGGGFGRRLETDYVYSSRAHREAGEGAR